MSSGLMTRPSVNLLFRENTSSMRLSRQKCVNSLHNMRVSYQTFEWGWACVSVNASVLCSLFSLKSLLCGRDFRGFFHVF